METAVSDDPVKGFLGRWSRLKREAAAADALPPAPPVATPPEEANAVVPSPLSAQALPDEAAEPPPLESLGFDSDYRAFLGQKVDEGLKRVALKKLFHTPHFNTMDGLDVYIEDFNLYEPLPASMVSQLAHAKETLNPTLPADWLTATPDSPSAGNPEKAADERAADAVMDDEAADAASAESAHADADDPVQAAQGGQGAQGAEAGSPGPEQDIPVSPPVAGSHSGSE